MKAMKDMLISAGANNLKKFGYPSVSSANILSDKIYRAFFKSMLEENRGRGVDTSIEELLKEIAVHDQKEKQEGGV